MRLSFPYPLMVWCGHVESTVQRIGCKSETLGGQSRSWSAEQGNYAYFCGKEKEKNKCCWATQSDYTVHKAQNVLELLLSPASSCSLLQSSGVAKGPDQPPYTSNYPNRFLFRRFLSPAPTTDSRKWSEIPMYPFESGRSTIWSDLIVETARQC